MSLIGGRSNRPKQMISLDRKELIMTMENLFANGTTATTGNSQLSGTATLTNVATEQASAIIEAMNADLETYADDLKSSMSDMNVLDNLIITLGTLETVDIQFLKDLDSSVLESMLKSQQSKRSRAKGKQMTAENYKTMMTAAIAESLIRLATGKTKGTSGARGNGTVAYDDERLAELANDQDALRKEIRNIQSKKSIMKSKAGFSEADEKWLQLCDAEDQLKSIRTTGSVGSKTVFVDTTKDELKEMLAEIDADKMKASDLKELIKSIQQLVFADEEETVEEEQTEEQEQEVNE